MGYLSILPAHLSTIETWIARIFVSSQQPSLHSSKSKTNTTPQLVLGAITIGPWALLLVYDFLLYTWRTATYRIPVVGGRARGRQRPNAPSLTERPSGHRRRFSIAALDTKSREERDGTDSETRRRVGGTRDGSEYAVVGDD